MLHEQKNSMSGRISLRPRELWEWKGVEGLVGGGGGRVLVVGWGLGVRGVGRREGGREGHLEKFNLRVRVYRRYERK